MPWHASLRLDLRLDAQEGRSLARFRHQGPLRILQSLYPEDPRICHNVLVHPPGGLVGGDQLDIGIRVEAGAHGLVTTPGATRFYRSDGEPAQQRTQIGIGPGARFEWLPLATLCTSGCIAHNRLVIEPESGAEFIGWDISALGLPGSSQPFVSGRLHQHIELPGNWLERATIDAADHRLLDGALGLAGQRCIGSIFFISGTSITRERREAALDAARAVAGAHPLAAFAGATSPQPRVIVLRVLAPLVEPVFDLLRRVWAAWRAELWQLPSTEPRSWSL